MQLDISLHHRLSAQEVLQNTTRMHMSIGKTPLTNPVDEVEVQKTKTVLSSMKACSHSKLHSKATGLPVALSFRVRAVRGLALTAVVFVLVY